MFLFLTLFTEWLLVCAAATVFGRRLVMPSNFIDFTENYHSNKPFPPLCWQMKADPV